MDDIQRVIDNLRCTQKIHGFPKYGKKAVDAAISAMQELQRYRQTGTPKECREAMEKEQGGLLEFGWIPVEERLPTQKEYLKDDGHFMLDDGNRRYQGLFDIYDGKFKFSKHISGIKYELFEDKCVIAWRPLPAPYQPKEERHGKMYSRKKGDC